MSGKEIIGFTEPHTERPTDDGPGVSPARFDLVQQLGEVKTVEIARIVAIAERLPERFGPDVIVGFLFCELLGRRPDRGEYASHVERLRGSPSSLPEIIAALLSLAKCETPLSPV